MLNRVESTEIPRATTDVYTQEYYNSTIIGGLDFHVITTKYRTRVH